MERLSLQQYIFEVVWPAFVTTLQIMFFTDVYKRQGSELPEQLLQDADVMLWEVAYGR